jgi:hypothetical protein
MRKLGLSLALFVGAAAPVAAQQMWQPEIGIRAGWTRFDLANSTTNIDIIDLPGVGGLLAGAAVNPSSLYGIIPLSGRFAIQPGFSWYNATLVGSVVTGMSAGARVNVALTSNFYAAAGINGYVVKIDGDEDAQAGFEGAVGYRRPMGSHFRTSAEVFYEKRGKSEALAELNSYGVRIGLGYGLGGSVARRVTGRPATASSAMWTRSIGLSGGWTLASFPGGNGDQVTFSLPFGGQSIAAGADILPGPSAFSVLFPVGEKIAIEPSVDYHRFQATGGDAVSTYEVGGRVNYAFNHTAYAAVGVELNGIITKGSGISDKSRTVGLVATGLRFPLTAGLSGRTEINYRVFDGNDVHPSGQATSFVFGILVPVK